jgi:hypothetical protein
MSRGIVSFVSLRSAYLHIGHFALHAFVGCITTETGPALCLERLASRTGRCLTALFLKLYLAKTPAVSPAGPTETLEVFDEVLIVSK